MRVHTRRQGRVALAGRMLVSQSYVDVAVPAPVKKLCECRALLRKDREARVPQIVESNQTRAIARVFPSCVGSAPPERHANGERGVHFASCLCSQVAKETASSMESCIQTDSPRGPHQRTTRGTTTGIPRAAARVSWA